MSDIWRCEVCERTFKRKYNFIRHKNRKIQCQKNDSKNGLSLASLAIEQPEELKDLPEMYVCSECGIKYKHHSSFSRHNTSKHGGVASYNNNMGTQNMIGSVGGNVHIGDVTNNNNNAVNLNKFGSDQEIEHVSDKYLIETLKAEVTSKRIYGNMFGTINGNKDIPQNRTMAMPSIASDSLVYYVDGYLESEPCDDRIKLIVHRYFLMLEDALTREHGRQKINHALKEVLYNKISIGAIINNKELSKEDEEEAEAVISFLKHKLVSNWEYLKTIPLKESASALLKIK